MNNAELKTLEGMTKKDISEMYGIAYSTLKGRLIKGWSLEKTLETPVKVLKIRSDRRILVERNGMAWDTYVSRVKRGWTEDRALNQPVAETYSKTAKARSIQAKIDQGPKTVVLRFLNLPAIDVPKVVKTPWCFNGQVVRWC